MSPEVSRDSGLLWGCGDTCCHEDVEEPVQLRSCKFNLGGRDTLLGLLSSTPVSDLRGGKGGLLADRREADDGLWFREAMSLSGTNSDAESEIAEGEFLGGTKGALFAGEGGFRLIRQSLVLFTDEGAEDTTDAISLTSTNEEFLPKIGGDLERGRVGTGAGSGLMRATVRAVGESGSSRGDTWLDGLDTNVHELLGGLSDRIGTGLPFSNASIRERMAVERDMRT